MTGGGAGDGRGCGCGAGGATGRRGVGGIAGEGAGFGGSSRTGASRVFWRDRLRRLNIQAVNPASSKSNAVAHGQTGCRHGKAGAAAFEVTDAALSGAETEALVVGNSAAGPASRIIGGAVCSATGGFTEASGGRLAWRLTALLTSPLADRERCGVGNAGRAFVGAIGSGRAAGSGGSAGRGCGRGAGASGGMPLSAGPCAGGRSSSGGRKPSGGPCKSCATAGIAITTSNAAAPALSVRCLTITGPNFATAGLFKCVVRG